LLAGCCYGNVTGVPWGVQYLPGTLPHYHQFQAGLIGAQELYSLPVHPTQLYEALNGLLVVGILLLVRRYIKAPGNYLTLSFILYCFFRFFSEFMRSPLAHATGGTVVGGLIKIQWCLLAAILGLSVLFIYREKYAKPALAASQPPPMPAMLLLLAGLVCITWGLRHWLTFVELLAVNIALLPAVVFVSSYFFRHIFLPPFRWLALGILVLPLLLMSQTLPSNPDGAKPDKNKISSFSSFKVGFATGKYQNDHTVVLSQGNDPNSSCDDQSITKYYQQQYTLQGAGYAYTKKRGNTEVTYGLNAFAGKHQETDVTDNTTIRQPVKTNLFGVNPYISYNTKWIGLGGGFVAGNLIISRENKSKDGSGPPTSANLKTPFYPQVFVRLGPTRYFFVDYQLAQQFPSALPGMRHQIGVGSGFGLRNGSFLRAGITGMEDVFVGGNIVLQNRIVLEPLYLWGTSQTPYQVQQRQFSLGLHYRFNH
ncbi:MAG: prolipoprotein diacylglyceryl transferase family protein, partial [Adhaeribacter sp.]